MLYSLLLSLMISSCATSRQIDEGKVTIASHQAESGGEPPTDTIPTAYIPLDITFYEIAFSGETTWKDIDQFYREKFLQQKETPGYLNLQQIILAHLISSPNSHFLEEAPQETIAYYVDEMANMERLLQPELIARCLPILSGYWDEAKIQTVASQVYHKAIAYIHKNFDDETAQRIMDRKREAFAELNELTGKVDH